MYKSMLVPTDGSKLSARAVTQAIQFARAIGAKITGLYVIPEYQMMLDEGYALPSTASLKQRFEDEAAARAEAILAEVAAEANQAGVACESVSIVGSSPWQVIIEQAAQRGCDLIMMASHGRKGLQSLLLGSETAKVLVHSKIPVLVVR
jgi:nucleotide-binding universal stress UspA family protein